MEDWSNIQTVVVKAKNGRELTFNNLYDALKFCSWSVIKNLTGRFYVNYNSTFYSWALSDYYQFRDELGMIIPIDFLKNRAKFYGLHYYTWSHKGDVRYKFRDGPVPYTGGRRRYRRWTRNKVRLLQEYRENAFLDYDDDLIGLKIKKRPRRCEKPDPWHDGHRRHREDNWKRQRKTQYK